MSNRSMHKSGLIRTDTDDREAILNDMAVAKSTHKILYFHDTIFKLESLWIWYEFNMSVCFTVKNILSFLYKFQNI